MPQQELTGAMPMLRYIGQVHEIVAALFFGDHARATERMDAMPADYPEVFVGIVQLPRFEMFRATLEARRCPKRGLARIRTLRRIRKIVRLVRRWAEWGPENFGPMAAICEGELDFARGRLDRAMAAFERARVGAMQSGASYLILLACLRIAGVARDAGQSFIADAAYEEALEVCEAWGALAVASRLRELGLAGI